MSTQWTFIAELKKQFFTWFMARVHIFANRFTICPLQSFLAINTKPVWIILFLNDFNCFQTVSFGLNWFTWFRIVTSWCTFFGTRTVLIANITWKVLIAHLYSLTPFNDWTVTPMIIIRIFVWLTLRTVNYFSNIMLILVCGWLCTRYCIGLIWSRMLQLFYQTWEIKLL